MGAMYTERRIRLSSIIPTLYGRLMYHLGGGRGLAVTGVGMGGAVVCPLVVSLAMTSHSEPSVVPVTR